MKRDEGVGLRQNKRGGERMCRWNTRIKYKLKIKSKFVFDNLGIPQEKKFVFLSLKFKK